MNTKINCLIIDDEKLARTLLENYIGKLPNLELVDQCKDPFEALGVLQQKQVDLIFLDIQMPELTGIEFLRTLPQHPLIVFTTAYQEYALEGYQMDVVDYLVKPFRFDRFLQAVNKAVRRLQQDTQLPGLFPERGNEEKTRAYLLINANHLLHKVFLDEICYIEGMKEYVAFHLKNRRIVAIQSLKQLEEELPKTEFLRIHKSYIVSREKVTAMDGNNVYLEKEQLPIGGSYKKQVQESLF